LLFLKLDKLPVRLTEKKRREGTIKNIRNKARTRTDTTEDEGDTVTVTTENKRISCLTSCH
jgi:hypothetical protein